MADSNTADLGKGKRITGETGPRWPTTCASATTAARASVPWPSPPNRSYGFVHRLLSESGATLRSRGGANRNSKKA